MSLRRLNRAKWSTGLVAGLLLFPLCLLATVRPRARSKHHESGRKPVRRRSRHVVRHLTRRQIEARRRAYLRRRELARRRRIHLSSDRVKEIQQALIKAGYLKPPADGQWGPETSQAMKAFQQANGFEATGLPEAKSLMKLGLGPHPLPSSLSRATSSAPGSKPAPSSGTATSSSSSSSSPASNDPQ